MQEKSFRELRKVVETLSKFTERDWEVLYKHLNIDVTPHQQTVSRSERFYNLMKELGIPANLKGYNYLIEAISILLTDKEMYDGAITKELYPAIAKKYKTTSSRVERAIRHAIEVATDRASVEIMYKIFGMTASADSGRLTNSEFIYGAANYIELLESRE